MTSVPALQIHIVPDLVITEGTVVVFQGLGKFDGKPFEIRRAPPDRPDDFDLIEVKPL